MASLPARQQSHRRTSPAQSDATQRQAQEQSLDDAAKSTAYGDPQTLFTKGQQTEQTEQEEEQSPPVQQVRPSNPDDDPSIKKCWICFSDSTEDTPETSPWRDPCPCALVAHEECLLDWIADTEAPKNRRNQSIAAPKIECPQCKAEIKLARPKDYVVEVVRALERLGTQAVTPGALTVLSGSLYQASLAWGMHSIYAIFGPNDGFRILQPLIQNSFRPPVEVYLNNPQQAAQKVLDLFLNNLVHWRLYLGVPLITPVLILSRTKFADSILPVLPVFFFATQSHGPDDPLNYGDWPPSASMCFAILPYLRSAYNLYYDKVWAEKEKRWLKEIQPRSSQPQEATNEAVADAGLGEAAANADDGGNIFEVRIDGGIWEEWEEGPEEAAEALNQAPPLRQPPLPDDAAQAQPLPNDAAGRLAGVANQQPQPNGPQPAAAQPAVANNERRLSFSPTAIAETVLGAILFPTIAGLSGELLKLILPRAWTVASAPTTYQGLRRIPGMRTSILQEKWGRSLVGGCLFVVAKDAVMLYVRWRMAEMHRRRRVVDYDRASVRRR
ncbi:hypothetical protein BAUCODRAFT_37878 [Baudoinia panamericana UAMH 10762]|uniref:RING-CH-type domain-containing protein n=1 Tax=Baudoinia panamericana (strain UAMH 10762) TaxID=717646 RepID=M2LG08_BAUPA|nr:uncharacterized protein BAUCODRAFT_37878 [Baudoinia panamericana UAMH 10762]EMC92967.1 hypothetical protein BAUCODRAFT_37878 [Baudoinia panamericana UAMH 10762]